MNNEITEEQVKAIIERYGKDAWFAVAMMSYSQLADYYLNLRRQIKDILKRADDAEAKQKEQERITLSYVKKLHESGRKLKECSEKLDWLENALNVDMRFYEDEEVVLINKILDDYNEKFFSIREEK